jgi:hypothetical protein
MIAPSCSMVPSDSSFHFPECVDIWWWTSGRPLTFHRKYVSPHPSTPRRKIRLIESNAKGRYLKKIYLKRDFAAGVYLPEAPSPPRFLFGAVRQLIGSECLTPAEYGLQQKTTPPPHQRLEGQ